MKKILFLMCIGFALTSCASVKDTGRQVRVRKDPQEQAIERAWALHQLGETKAALKALDKIANSRPLTQISVDALLLSADILMKQEQSKRALELFAEFEKRARGTSLNLSKITDAKELAKKASKPKRPHETPKVSTPELVSQVDSQPKFFANAVGVLLPLSGPFKVYGERALAAMQLSLLNPSIRLEDGASILQAQDGFSLVVIDTKGQNDASKEGVDKLVDTFRVGVIIGDILSDTAAAIAQRAKERDVINLALSRKEGLTLLGPKVYRLAVTPKKQVAALLKAATEKDHKRFAILYPENAFGVEMRNAFVAEAKSSGAEVVKIEGYNPNETTFTAHIKKLVGARRTAGNPMYERCIEKSSKLIDVNAKKKADKDCFDAVAPNVEFDSLFVPDFPKNLGYIIPALISEGIMVSQNSDMVGAYRRTSRLPDAEPVQLLGPSSWHSAALGEKLGPQIDGALFVDSGNSFDADENAVRFSESFQKMVASAPASADALAFDSIGLLKEIFQLNKKDAEVPMSAVLGELQRVRFAGLSGDISFDESRESIVPFRSFSFQDGQILPHL